MVALTTRQRDLLQLLLRADGPQGAGELAVQMNLTPRQINYGLKGLAAWLTSRGITLKITPGIGVVLDCVPGQRVSLLRELAAESHIQLVLSREQRQQLLALILITAVEPLILYQMQQLTQVSRTTVVKDLDALTDWFESVQLRTERRPNYGIWLEGSEQSRRQALAALAWGGGTSPFSEPVIEVDHTRGLLFSLADDADLLPIVQRANDIIHHWDMRRTLSLVAHAEAQLGGRFTDDAVLYLAFTFAVQASRIQLGQTIRLDESCIEQLRHFPVWVIADQIARRLAWQSARPWPAAEIALTTMYLLAAPRNERWPDDLALHEAFARLTDEMMRYIGEAYRLPNLCHDETLRDGIITHIVPAFYRQRFQLWMPVALPTAELPERYQFERSLARDLLALVAKYTAVSLPESEASALTLLLRAAYIRELPDTRHQVIVVCPSGMATAQLLVARLRARFPRLGRPTVLSMRELMRNPSVSAELIITTVPLPPAICGNAKVIKVHPLLSAEDIEAITQWLA